MDNAKELVKAQYSRVGDAYVRSAGHASGNDLPRMLELADPDGSETMLDIATGGGHVVRVFAPHVRQVIASDLTPEILRHTAKAFEEWGITNAVIAEADAENPPFDDEQFDIVTCRIAPHHFPNPEVFVHEVARVLTPGGAFLLVDSTVPDGNDGVFFNRFEKIRDHSHMRSLTVEEWQNLIVGAGLTLVHNENFLKRHEFTNWVSRSRTSSVDIATLETMLTTATPAQMNAFEIEFDVAHAPLAFSDTKTLFHAVKNQPGRDNAKTKLLQRNNTSAEDSGI